MALSLAGLADGWNLPSARTHERDNAWMAAAVQNGDFLLELPHGALVDAVVFANLYCHMLVLEHAAIHLHTCWRKMSEGDRDMDIPMDRDVSHCSHQPLARFYFKQLEACQATLAGCM